MNTDKQDRANVVDRSLRTNWSNAVSAEDFLAEEPQWQSIAFPLPAGRYCARDLFPLTQRGGRQPSTRARRTVSQHFTRYFTPSLPPVFSAPPRPNASLRFIFDRQSRRSFGRSKAQDTAPRRCSICTILIIIPIAICIIISIINTTGASMERPITVRAPVNGTDMGKDRLRFMAADKQADMRISHWSRALSLPRL